MFILDTALVHVAFVDASGAVGFGCEKDTPNNFSFFVRSTGGSVCTKVVDGLEGGEARNWHGVLFLFQISLNFFFGISNKCLLCCLIIFYSGI